MTALLLELLETVGLPTGPDPSVQLTVSQSSHTGLA